MREVSETVSPDSLMKSFRGRNIVGVLLLAITVHVVIIVGTSASYLRNVVFGTDTSEMGKEARVQIALGEATTALDEIAKRHNLRMDDITAKFTVAGSRSSKVNEPATPPAQEAGDAPGVTEAKPVSSEVATEKAPEREVSEFEKELKKPVKGPDAPGDDIDEDMGL